MYGVQVHNATGGGDFGLGYLISYMDLYGGQCRSPTPTSHIFGISRIWAKCEELPPPDDSLEPTGPGLSGTCLDPFRGILGAFFWRSVAYIGFHIFRTRYRFLIFLVLQITWLFGLTPWPMKLTKYTDSKVICSVGAYTLPLGPLRENMSRV